MFKSRKRGFTLIELLVVIAIIGILSSVVLASLNSAREKSRDARRISDVKQIQLALELYFDSNGEYPQPEGTGDVPTTALESQGFMSSVPVDPTTDEPYGYGAPADPATNFVIQATLEDDAHQALDDDVDGTVLTIDCGTMSGETETPAAYCVQP